MVAVVYDAVLHAYDVHHQDGQWAPYFRIIQLKEPSNRFAFFLADHRQCSNLTFVWILKFAFYVSETYLFVSFAIAIAIVVVSVMYSAIYQ